MKPNKKKQTTRYDPKLSGCCGAPIKRLSGIKVCGNCQSMVNDDSCPELNRPEPMHELHRRNFEYGED